MASKEKRNRPDAEGKLEALGVGARESNYPPFRVKGEIDLVGFDGSDAGIRRGSHPCHGQRQDRMPELSITSEKHEAFVRAAKHFLLEWHLSERPVRFDVLVIDNSPGLPPIVRLRKDALSPEIRRSYLSRI